MLAELGGKLMNKPDKRQQQINFEFKMIIIPYVIFAIIVSLINIFYPQIKIHMLLFGLFFAYNFGMLFVAFFRHFTRTLILMLILTILSGAVFFLLLYVFGINHQIFG